jgi:hypothetical protein
MRMRCSLSCVNQSEKHPLKARTHSYRGGASHRGYTGMSIRVFETPNKCLTACSHENDSMGGSEYRPWEAQCLGTVRADDAMIEYDL